MSLDLPHTRSSTNISPPLNSNSAATLLLQQSLEAARNKVDRKGKGSQRVKKRERSRLAVGSERGDVEGEITGEVHAPPPPAYEIAIEQSTSTSSPRPIPQTRRRTRTASNASISSSSSSLASTSSSSVTSDADDALSDLLRLTTSLLTTSNEILQTSHSLHTQISRFLISSSPPPASPSIPQGQNDSTRWKELETLERDVERFGMRKEGKDPRRNLMRAGESQRAVSTATTTNLLENDSRNEASDTAESERNREEEEDQVGLGLGTPTSSLGRVGGAGHLRRSSTAKDLLLQLSSSSNHSTPTRPTKLTFLPTPSPSPRGSTSRETLDSPSPSPALLSPARKSSLTRENVVLPSPSGSTHRLSISPSLPSLSSSSSSASISTLLTHSPLIESPSPATPASSSRIRTLNNKASPFLTSITPSLSSFDSSSTPSTISTSPPASRRRPSSSTHRRTSTITKSNAVSSLDSDSQDPLHSGSTVDVRQASGGGGAALDRLRMLRGDLGDEIGSGKTKNEAGNAQGSSWWGWR
ncbi:hypothetical protein JCM5353_005868 [Sporobolomyces roseus]